MSTTQRLRAELKQQREKTIHLANTVLAIAQIIGKTDLPDETKRILATMAQLARAEAL